jgi:hypothetical protein
LFGQWILSKNLQLECILHCLIHFSDMTPLFGQWILSMNLQLECILHGLIHFSDMTPLFGQWILSKNLQLECILHCLIHFSDMTPLFGQWILSKYLQFILLLSRIWNLTFCHFRLKDLFLIFWDLSRTTAGFLMSALCLNTSVVFSI